MITISYGDIAVGAKEQFVPTVNNKEGFVDLSELQQSIEVRNYSSIGELNQTILDGRSEMFPTEPTQVYMGYWSNMLSSSDGSFSIPIVLTLESENRISTPGFTFTFDTATGCYCDRLTITWFRGIDELGSQEFYPDNSVYACENRVEAFDRAIITFNSLNMPYRRLQLRSIEYGIGRVFVGEDIYNAKVIEEINPISDSLNINTFDFSLIASEGAEFVFQKRQPLEVRHNGDLIGMFFVERSKRRANGHYDVQAEDYIGLLDKVQFPGDVYTGVSARSVIEDICTLAGVPYEIISPASGFLMGHVPAMSCREALAHVCFIARAVVDTSRNDKIRIFRPPSEIVKTFELEEVLGYQDIETSDPITEVHLTYYDFSYINEEAKVVYDAGEGGTGNGIHVKFQEPIFIYEYQVGVDESVTPFWIENGTIIEASGNYAIINANEGCVLYGTPVKIIERLRKRKNPLTTILDSQNVVESSSSRLVNSLNYNDMISFMSDYLFCNRTITQKVVLSGQKVGDRVRIRTQNSGDIEGMIESLRYPVTGGMIIAEAVIRIDY